MTSRAKNLTAYGGLLPVATMLEKLGFQQLVEETLTVKRLTRAMPAVSVRAGHGAGALRGFFAAASSAVSGAGADADRNSESVAAAAAVHLLAVPGLAASGAWRGNCWKCSGACGNGYGKRPTCDWRQ